jgi:photosystem II stability/assembly factor-like uncharacterized protein
MSKRLWIATRKGLFPVEKKGARWIIGAPQFVGKPVTMALEDKRTGRIYAALNEGHFGVHLHVSSNGTDWQELPAPAFHKSDAPDAPSVIQIWSLEPGAPNEPGVLWAGTVGGGLFQSRDHGSSWSLNDALWNVPDRAKWFGGGNEAPGIHSILIDPRDARHIKVAVSCGGVWESRDGGKTWEVKCKGMFAEYMPPEQREDPAIQDPHRMVQCRGAPHVHWVQHHNGIFLSTDDLKTWTSIPEAGPSTFGFAVAAHPSDAKTAWFVPAKKDEARYPVDGRFVVTRTRDGGSNFETLTRGLPEAPSYDLVFRHALDVDDSGEGLALGSTTGNLWVSENGGDSFTLVSAHLPPIYAVRFAP